MRLLALFAMLVFSLDAQEPNDKLSQQAISSAEGGASADKTKVDPRLHADVIRLVELDGVRQRELDAFKQHVDIGKLMLARKDPAVGEEWARRMLSRVNLDDHINIYVHAYEKYFTDDEIVQLIALQVKKGSLGVEASPQLKQKLIAVSPSLQNEIATGIAQIDDKLVAEIGEEYREHPEEFKQLNPSQSATSAGRDSQPDQGKADPKLHADVVRLLELNGTRGRIQGLLKQLVANSKTFMMQRYPSCTPSCDPAFGEEWEKRMLVRADVDGYFEVWVRLYAKYFTDDEIIQLTEKNVPQGNTLLELQQKLNSASLQNEIAAGSAILMSKSIEIGQEIEREHPEYFKKPQEPK